MLEGLREQYRSFRRWQAAGGFAGAPDRQRQGSYGDIELVRHALHAFAVTNTGHKYDMVARVHGGGLTGQAGALRMAIARALAREDESLRPLLSRERLLTRDARMKERKKYGQPGARKRFQFSKR